MSKQLMDDEINLKRRARSRLIGATALTVIVVAALPMLLDDEPKSVGQDIELRIPDKDKVGEFIPRMAASSVSATSAVSPSSAPAITNPVTQSASAAISQAVSYTHLRAHETHH
jgi:DedD protein